MPDVLASSANYLNALGWRRGEPWLKEVRVPESMDWAEADLTIEKPVSEWERKGVHIADGSRVPGSCRRRCFCRWGKNGPAFLAFQNFKVFLEWNQSLVYSTTVAYLATRIEGAPAVSRGNAVPFGYEPTKELQGLLRGRGFYDGEVDGKLGLATRASVKKAQQKFGLPADSYPSPELIARLRILAAERNYAGLQSKQTPPVGQRANPALLASQFVIQALPKREPGSHKGSRLNMLRSRKASPFRDLITPMFPPAEEAMKTLANFRSTVMAGLDPAIQS